MIEMKTTELIGAALDWAVAMAEGAKPERPHDGQVSFDSVHLLCGSDQERGFHAPLYSPSTNWNQGGPLIEEHDINTIRCNDLYFPKGNEHGDFYEPYWEATIDGGTDAGTPLYKTYGPTPLIAAMRCLVASKLGDTVQIPSELIQ